MVHQDDGQLTDRAAPYAHLLPITPFMAYIGNPLTATSRTPSFPSGHLKNTTHTPNTMMSMKAISKYPLLKASSAKSVNAPIESSIMLILHSLPDLMVSAGRLSKTLIRSAIDAPIIFSTLVDMHYVIFSYLSFAFP